MTTENDKGAAPEAGAQTASTEPALTDNGIGEDISNLLAYDPFPGGDAPAGADLNKPKDDKNTSGAAAGKAGEPAQGQTKPAADGSTAQPAKDGGEPNDAERWRQLAEEYKSLYEGGKSTAPNDQPKADDKPKAPAFNFSIEDGLLQALNSEDPAERKNGIKFLADGVANSVHDKVMEQVGALLQKLTSEDLPSKIQSYIQSTNQQRAVFQDFYGTYKQLNKPELYPLIQNVAQIVAKEKKYTSYNQQMKKEVAERVFAILNIKPEAQDAGTQNNGAAQHPALSGGNNSRPAVQVSESDDIINTLGF